MKLKQNKPSDEIPTSSMADIAFLLIVYFMVTTTFAATRGLDFALPKDDDTPPIVEKEDSVLVEVNAFGDVLVDQKPTELEDIFDYLKPKLERNPKKPVIIKPDPEAPYGSMVKVFDTLRRIKIKIDGTAVSVREIDMKIIQEAEAELEEGENLESILGKDVNVSIPTQREIESFWY
ncbi:MAG: biopolymer transporter ExbD [bacterium]|nr:biopolymer transporter ExbD [bacterium]